MTAYPAIAFALGAWLGGTLAAAAQTPDVLDASVRLTSARPGLPIADPLAVRDTAPPPFSLIADRPVKPAYVPSLPGLREGTIAHDDFGRKAPKYDAVFIRKSRVDHGEVVIPPGGLAYHEDTWGGEVALRGEQVPLLDKMMTYVDYDMSIVVKDNVTIPAGQSVSVGGQVYQYYATVLHGQTANHTLHVKTIAGTDWEWAFGSPVLSSTQTQWWGGMKFAQLYNQGQAREVDREKMVFDWLSGVRMDRVVLAGEALFSGLASAGEHWISGSREIRVTQVDEKAGTVTVEVLEGGKPVVTKTLGPVDSGRLIEDTTARKALVFESGDVIGFLSPWPAPFKDGKANLKIYDRALSLRYGEDFAGDRRFSVYPVGCPTGHNFGFMLVNKQEIRLKPGAAYDGPQGYFKVAVDDVRGGQVLGWHVEDRQGNPSINLGGPGVENVDLVLGQGRVAGQAILKDVGRAMLQHVYRSAEAGHASPPSMMASLLDPRLSVAAALAVGAFGIGAVGYEFGRRRSSAA